MYVTWNLEGLEEMMSRLEAMEKNGKKAMNKAIEEGAKVLEEEMKLNIQERKKYMEILVESEPI